MMQIRDPIHGYITLEGMYADIINTPEFQRLRSIEQGSFRPVFPGARHDRFIHSLGTYHLAGKFADHFFRNIEKDLSITLPPSEVEMLKTTFRYAALLHDIGHAPFSHTTEDFFTEKKDPKRPGVPMVWTQLCEAIRKEAPQEYSLFWNPRQKEVGAAHEIVSATVLVSDQAVFIKPSLRKNVDLALAARMVIGFTYKPGDAKRLYPNAGPNAPASAADAELPVPAAGSGSPAPVLNPPAPGNAQALGIRNCLIQLLNSKLMDVDRLDYLGRDTQMSGFVNAPLDLDCLAASVTAVKQSGGMLVPAFRSNALSVFDLMFQAKLSHDAWVLASPAGPYDAALRAHCIRLLNDRISPDYMKTVFSRDALSRKGVTLDHVKLEGQGSSLDNVQLGGTAQNGVGLNGVLLNGREYRLLSDVEVSADLKAQSGGVFDELNTRQLGERRVASWRSYYEYAHIFKSANNSTVTPEKVYEFFKPLLGYLKKNNIFIFDPAVYNAIPRIDDLKKNIRAADPDVLKAADFLDEYLRSIASNSSKADSYNVVLLDMVNRFTLKIDPAEIRIVFPNSLQSGIHSFSTYTELTGITADHIRSRKFFYLYRHGIPKHKQLTKLRDALETVL